MVAGRPKGPAKSGGSGSGTTGKNRVVPLESAEKGAPV